MPIVDEMHDEPDRKASCKTDQKTCPEHWLPRSEQACIMLRCGGDIAAHYGQWRDCDFRGKARQREPEGRERVTS
jgi:hypothetical protein